MRFDEIKAIANQHQIKIGKATKGDLILSIQYAEGNSPCFGSDSSMDCGQENCLWRDDCV